jgi:hypothetical protein
VFSHGSKEDAFMLVRISNDAFLSTALFILDGRVMKFG